MLKSKNELEQYLESKIFSFISNTELCQSIYNYAKETYNIPRTLTSDLITMRISLSEASEFVLFCLLDAIEKMTQSKSTKIDSFYTMQEVKTYRVSKFETERIKFPLKYKLMKITEDQWIGSIDIKHLMKLREAQLINYNVNAQRTMQRIIKGNKEIYKITLNQVAINAIESLFQNGIYIPTPFTLNIPQDSMADFYYDEDNNELVIKSLEHFDIIDGYHRYIAACQISDTNPDFNYNMELRIINFSEDKAKQFIYQEDQKTKMRKIDSDSLNMNKAANIVATRLNESSQCNLQGLISRNQGLINLGDLAQLIHYFYFKEYLSKEKEKITIILAVKELIENFNLLTEYDIKYLEKKYSFKDLVAIMYTFNYFKDKDKNHMCEIMDKIIDATNKIDNKKFYSKIPKKSLMNDIDKIIKEVE